MHHGTAAILDSEYPFSALLRASDRDVLLGQIVESVWATTLELPVSRRDDGEDLDHGPGDHRTVVGTVRVEGAWPMTVALVGSLTLAARCAERMFAAQPGSLGSAELCDAWGELVNQVGGNLKALIQPPGRLGLPVVTEGDGYTWRAPGTRVINELTFASVGGRLRLTVARPDPAP
mgnify:CR=1 FL=1